MLSTRNSLKTQSSSPSWSAQCLSIPRRPPPLTKTSPEPYSLVPKRQLAVTLQLGSAANSGTLPATLGPQQVPAACVRDAAQRCHEHGCQRALGKLPVPFLEHVTHGLGDFCFVITMNRAHEFRRAKSARSGNFRARGPAARRAEDRPRAERKMGRLERAESETRVQGK